MNDTENQRQARRLLNAVELQHRMSPHPRLVTAQERLRAVLADLDAVQDAAMHAQAAKHLGATATAQESRCWKCGFLLIDGACNNDECPAWGPGGQAGARRNPDANMGATRE